MMTVLYSGAWAGTGYIDDMKSGVMDQLLSAPIGRSAIVTGQLLQQLVINAAQSAIVLGIGWLGGARYPGGVGGILLALVAATLLATAFCCASTAVALITGNQLALIMVSQIVVLPGDLPLDDHDAGHPAAGLGGEHRPVQPAHLGRRGGSDRPGRHRGLGTRGRMARAAGGPRRARVLLVGAVDPLLPALALTLSGGRSPGRHRSARRARAGSA